MVSVKKVLATGALAAVVTLPAVAQDDMAKQAISMRQSFFKLTGMAFGPMGAMVKGDIPWDTARFAMLADDLDGLVGYTVERGFAPGSEMGRTKAKPEIWENMDDFNEKLAALREQAAKLNEVAATGDTDAMKMQFGATGKACKACHDEYKSKDYLY